MELQHARTCQPTDRNVLYGFVNYNALALHKVYKIHHFFSEIQETVSPVLDEENIQDVYQQVLVNHMWYIQSLHYYEYSLLYTEYMLDIQKMYWINNIIHTGYASINKVEVFDKYLQYM